MAVPNLVIVGPHRNSSACVATLSLDVLCNDGEENYNLLVASPELHELSKRVSGGESARVCGIRGDGG